MKYIKKFEAKKRKNSKENIWEFCKLYLTPLKDDPNFKYKITPNTIVLLKDGKYERFSKPIYNSPNERCNLLEIYKERIVSTSRFGERYNESRPIKTIWLEVKDDIIQFILMAEHVYGLVNTKQNIIFDSGSRIISISIDNLEKIGDDFEFSKLFINISNK